MGKTNKKWTRARKRRTPTLRDVISALWDAEKHRVQFLDALAEAEDLAQDVENTYEEEDAVKYSRRLTDLIRVADLVQDVAQCADDILSDGTPYDKAFTNAHEAASNVDAKTLAEALKSKKPKKRKGGSK